MKRGLFLVAGLLLTAVAAAAWSRLRPDGAYALRHHPSREQTVKDRPSDTSASQTTAATETRDAGPEAVLQSPESAERVATKVAVTQQPGEPPGTGSLTKEQIRRTIRLEINEARRCAEEGKARNPNMGHRATVRFVIAPNGTVQEASLADSGTGDPATDACLVDAVRRREFPAPKDNGRVVVTYPFIFDFIDG